MVFDSRPKNSLVIVGSNLFDAVVGNPFPKKYSNIIRIDGEYGSLDDLAIDGLQYFTSAKYNIGGAPSLFSVVYHIYPG